MKVVRAKSAGACYGVKRALEIAERVAGEGGGAQTLGPLIHNPQVVDGLKARGVGVAQTVADVVAPTVVVRSHGVTPQAARELKALGANVVDATCPHVLRAQKAAMELASQGKTVLILGEHDHPEVEGLKAWAEEAACPHDAKVQVVSGAAEIAHDIAEPVGVVAQTTQTADALDEVEAELRSRGLRPDVRSTICHATAARQDAAFELASRVDAMVVVGGRNSSNTRRLHQICSQVAPKAFHVEAPSDLRKADFEGCHVVGLTAGASTPESQIAAVEDCLLSW